MSSFVQKQRQQGATEQQGEPPSSNMQKGLSRRVSFEKLRVTALQFRLDCTKSPREALKFWLEMILLRSRIITAAFNLLLSNVVQLSNEWNSAFLRITNVVLPKWQIRAQHIVDTAILQRQWLRQQESSSRITPQPEVQTKEPANEISKPPVIVAEPLAAPAKDVSRSEGDNQRAVVESLRFSSEEQLIRKRLTIALTACVIILALQISMGAVLLYQSVNGLPLGLVFQVACLAYIAYLLQSICDFTRLNVTNCNYGKAAKVSRKVLNTPVVAEEAIDTAAVKVIQLSFLEKTMSKVKLL